MFTASSDLLRSKPCAFGDDFAAAALGRDVFSATAALGAVGRR